MSCRRSFPPKTGSDLELFTGPLRGLFNGSPLRCIALGLTVPVFAIEPCRSALARLRTITRELDNTRLWHGWSEGLAHGITQSSAANYATGTFKLLTSSTILPKVYHTHLRAWGNLEPPTLRRYRQRGPMGKAKGY